MEFAHLQNVMDSLVESANAVSLFYVFPELDGFLAVLFLKVLCYPGVLQKIDEMELAKALESYIIEESRPKIVKAGKRRPFKPFKAIRMKGEGPTASQMVIEDRF